MPKIAVVLCAGGDNGALQVGMLRSLLSRLCDPVRIWRGSSVGSINAAWMGQASATCPGLQMPYARTLEHLWTEEIAGAHSIYKKPCWLSQGIRIFLKGRAMLDPAPLKSLLRKKIDMHLLRTSGADVAVQAVDLVTGELKDYHPDDLDWWAGFDGSWSIPLTFPAVCSPTFSEVLADSGVMSQSPLPSAVHAGADVVYVLATHQLYREAGKLKVLHPYSTPSVFYDYWAKASEKDKAVRALDLMIAEVLIGDIERTQFWTRAVCRDPAFATKRPIELHILSPRKMFPGTSLDFEPSIIRAQIEHGKEIGADPTTWL